MSEEFELNNEKYTILKNKDKGFTVVDSKGFPMVAVKRIEDAKPKMERLIQYCERKTV